MICLYLLACLLNIGSEINMFKPTLEPPRNVVWGCVCMCVCVVGGGGGGRGFNQFYWSETSYLILMQIQTANMSGPYMGFSTFVK